MLFRSGESNVTMTGKDGKVNRSTSNGDTWLEVGIGGDFAVGKTESTTIYYELEKTFKSDFDLKLQATVGFRYTFN